MPAASATLGNSQTKHVPTVDSSETTTGRDICHAKADVGPAPQQQTRQAVQASATDQPAVQATTAAVRAKRRLPAADIGLTPAQTDKATVPTGSAALKQSAGKRRGPRWPGSCSQGAVADANHLHGVAAAAVRPHRSKSCSAGGRQHTAKKLVFKQLSLAQPPFLQSSGPVQGCNAFSTQAAASVAMCGTAQQPVVALKQAVDASAVAAPKQQAGQGPVGVLLPSTAPTGVNLAEAGVAAVPHGVSHTTSDTPAAAVSHQHGPAGSDRQCTEADKANSGSQEQWETAVSKLSSLAQKHSQVSQDMGTAINTATDMLPESGAMQEHKSMPTDEQHLARKGGTAFLGSGLLPVAHSPMHGKRLQQQVAAPGRSTAQVVALAGTAGQLQVPINASSSITQASQGAPMPKVGAQGYTGLSRLRAIMRDQKQQQQQHRLETDPLKDTGSNPAVVPDLQQVQKLAEAPEQHSQQVISMTHRQPAVVKAKAHQPGENSHAEQGHKRKRLEADACDQVKPHSAGVALRMPAAKVPCKGQCISATSRERSHTHAAHGRQNIKAHSLVYGKRPADAAQLSSQGAPDQSEPLQATSTLQNRVALVAWPTRCEPNQESAHPCDSRQLPLASPVVVAMGGGDALAAAAVAETAVKALTDEAATAGVVVGEAAVLPPGGQQDKSQGGSEPHQGGLRLDLSSEEDPLLCTQKLPSSQGVQLLHICNKGYGCCHSPRELQRPHTVPRRYSSHMQTHSGTQ